MCGLAPFVRTELVEVICIWIVLCVLYMKGLYHVRTAQETKYSWRDWQFTTERLPEARKITIGYFVELPIIEPTLGCSALHSSDLISV